MQFPDESLQIRAELLQVRVLFARGAYEQVRQHVQTLLVRAQSSPFRPVQQLYRAVLTCQARLQLTEGKLLAVPSWISPSGQVLDELSFEQQEQEAFKNVSNSHHFRVLVINEEVETACVIPVK